MCRCVGEEGERGVCGNNGNVDPVQVSTCRGQREREGGEYYDSETCWQERGREARTSAKRWPFVSGAWRGVDGWDWAGGEHG